MGIANVCQTLKTRGLNWKSQTQKAIWRSVLNGPTASAEPMVYGEGMGTGTEDSGRGQLGIEGKG